MDSFKRGRASDALQIEFRSVVVFDRKTGVPEETRNLAS